MVALISVCILFLLRPSAMADPVFFGNTYTIHARASTNHPDYYSNRFMKRVNIYLSTDSGSNWQHRLAFGYPVDPDRMDAIFSYSLPWWRSDILTEHARIRFTEMDGETELCRSLSDFTIAGIICSEPYPASDVRTGTYMQIQWAQAGAGGSVQMGWITPTNVVWSPVTTFTGCLPTPTVNSRVWLCEIPPAPQVKLVFRSISDTNVIGYSAAFEVQP